MEQQTETTQSFFNDPFAWLMNFMTVQGNKRAEMYEEQAEHHAIERIETKMIQDHVAAEIGIRAKQNIDMGVASADISPEVYAMLSRVEEAHDHTPNVEASMRNVQQDNEIKM